MFIDCCDLGTDKETGELLVSSHPASKTQLTALEAWSAGQIGKHPQGHLAYLNLYQAPCDVRAFMVYLSGFLNIDFRWQ